MIVPEYWDLLKSCWHQDPLSRPPFEDINRILSGIHVEAVEDEQSSEAFSLQNLRRLEGVEMALCIWDFISIASDELTLYVGDLVEVLVHEGEWTR